VSFAMWCVNDDDAGNAWLGCEEGGWTCGGREEARARSHGP
jgi:hypothetical protein